MNHPSSFPVIVTAQVVFHDDVGRALFEFDQSEHLRRLVYRLQVLQAAMHRVERLRRIAADASNL
jgi:hypothetical protein